MNKFEAEGIATLIEEKANEAHKFVEQAISSSDNAYWYCNEARAKLRELLDMAKNIREQGQ